MLTMQNGAQLSYDKKYTVENIVRVIGRRALQRYRKQIIFSLRCFRNMSVCCLQSRIKIRRLPNGHLLYKRCPRQKNKTKNKKILTKKKIILILSMDIFLLLSVLHLCVQIMCEGDSPYNKY